MTEWQSGDLDQNADLCSQDRKVEMGKKILVKEVQMEGRTACF